jgi:hypothetical protein
MRLRDDESTTYVIFASCTRTMRMQLPYICGKIDNF